MGDEHEHECKVCLTAAYDRIKSRIDYTISNPIEQLMSMAKDMTPEQVSQARQILNARIRDIELEGEPKERPHTQATAALEATMTQTDKQAHTATPWKVDGSGRPWIVIDTGFEATETRYVVGSFQSLHDAEEVVATRNACMEVGLKREALEAGVVADLLAACEALLARCGSLPAPSLWMQEIIAAEMAIALARPQAR